MRANKNWLPTRRDSLKQLARGVDKALILLAVISPIVLLFLLGVEQARDYGSELMLGVLVGVIIGALIDLLILTES